MGSFTPHRGTHCFISNDTPISWACSLLRGTQRSIFVLERMTHPAHGHLPYTGAHNVPSPSQRERHTELMGIFPTQGHTTFHLRLREEQHTHLMGTPISWAHPTHGLSHRLTHSVCVLEDVSRNCNHQQVYDKICAC
jgi:hypothetical protein